jgi:protein-S-isoprenylcysteine O-methyltransferase Ste14
MYLAMALTLIGVALLLGSLAPLIAPPIFIRLITTRFIQKEEAALERRFGDRYRDYKQRVRRWI